MHDSVLGSECACLCLCVEVCASECFLASALALVAWQKQVEPLAC